MAVASLRSQLQMDHLGERHNSVIEKIRRVAPDSLFFHTEMQKVYSEHEHLRQEVKAWSRLLSLGSLPSVPIPSLMELQRQRGRIMHRLQAMERELDRLSAEKEANAVAANLVQSSSQQNGTGPAIWPHSSFGYTFNAATSGLNYGAQGSSISNYGPLALRHIPGGHLGSPPPLVLHPSSSSSSSSNISFPPSSSGGSGHYPASEVSSSVSTLSTPSSASTYGYNYNVTF